jgi:hypothetical protein
MPSTRPPGSCTAMAVRIYNAVAGLGSSRCPRCAVRFKSNILARTDNKLVVSENGILLWSKPETALLKALEEASSGPSSIPPPPYRRRHIAAAAPLERNECAHDGDRTTNGLPSYRDDGVRSTDKYVACRIKEKHVGFRRQQRGPIPYCRWWWWWRRRQTMLIACNFFPPRANSSRSTALDQKDLSCSRDCDHYHHHRVHRANACRSSKTIRGEQPWERNGLCGPRPQT